MNFQTGTLNVAGQSRIDQGGSSVGRLDMSGGSNPSRGEMLANWLGGSATINLSGGAIAANGGEKIAAGNSQGSGDQLGNLGDLGTKPRASPPVE